MGLPHRERSADGFVQIDSGDQQVGPPILRIGIGDAGFLCGLPPALAGEDGDLAFAFCRSGAIEPPAFRQPAVLAGDHRHPGLALGPDGEKFAVSRIRHGVLRPESYPSVLFMRVAVLASGGVDSSVALALLAEAGHQVEAFYLKVWLEDELADIARCPWEEDLGFAQGVTEKLGIPLRVVSLQQVYRERVVDGLLRELRAGGTPSPDLFCNSRIKFGAFLDWLDAEAPGFDRVGSGHYATVAPGPSLLRGRDSVKDQTYFLSRLSARQLERALFPVGRLEKSEVRERAAALGLSTHDRPDSQGICFLGGVRYRDFVRAQLGERPGPVIEEATGKQLGEHRGHWFFTIGQRRGLGLGGGPWFVSGKDPETDRILVRRESAPPVSRFGVRDFHWIGAPAETGAPLLLRLRHGPELLRGHLEGSEVILEEPDPGIATGQFAVFYRGEECLGSARIQR